MTNINIGKILVVDDEVELKTILVEALVSQGYEAAGFTAGEDALALLREQPFDILVTDLMMPGMDGITLVRQGVQVDPHLICIVMTGQGTIQTAVDAMKVGAFDYVLKPFRLQTMLPVLTRAMNARHLRLENVQLREAVAIHELSETIAFTLDPQTVLSKLADAALQQSEADEVSVLLPTAAGDEFYVAAVRGEKRERLLGERVPFGRSISSWVARQHTSIILNGEVRDDRFVSLWPRPDIRSSVSIPMLVAKKLVGVLNVNVVDRPRPFTLGQMKALTILAGTAAAALESASLYTQAQQAEENYRSIFENAVEGIFRASPDGQQFLSVNPAMANMFGYNSSAEMIEAVVDISQQLGVKPERREQTLQRLGQDGELKNFEEKAQRKDGSEIWISATVRAAFDAQRELLYLDGIVQDITVRKRAEAERTLISEIIQGVITTPDLDELLKLIHSSISKILYAENCYVALYEKKTGLLHLPLCFDKYDPVAPSMKLGKGLTAYVFRSGRSMLMTPESIHELIAQGEVELIGTLPAVWLGVPLKTPTETVGVLVVQHYEDEHAYSQRDLELLSSVGDQIALAIERKRAEDQLREAKDFSENLIQTANVIILGMDPDGNINIFNQTAEQITGYTLPELKGRNWFETLVPKDRYPYVWDEFTRLIDGETPQTFENPILTKSGEERQIIWENNQIRVDGKIVATISFGNDITERKRAEEALRESEERYRDLVENAHDIIFAHDLKGNYTSVNRAGEQITGYTHEECLALNIADTIAPEDVRKVREMMSKKLVGEKVTAYEVELLAKDGSRIAVEVNTKLILQDGLPIGVQGIARNVTERKQLEDQLRQSQKMEAIGQLAGGVAHDFNNLLTAINGYSSLALQRIEDNHPLRSYLEEIKKAGDRAANLTRQLLAFGRKQILQPLPINLNDIVTDMNKMLRRLIGEDVELTAKLDPALKNIKADPGQIEQVLVNLVVNARDAMPKGGHLTIETASVELDQEYARRRVGVLPGSYVMLAVSDTGMGMNPETQERIFDPFFTTKEKGKGTGLGLSTVYGIVKQSGGNIWVYSEAGRGTTFKVYLPELEIASAKTDTAVVEAPMPSGSETILLVEDEDVVRGLAATILEQSGYKVLTASRGEEAIRLCLQRAEPIHLLLTDVVMPETSGKEIADRLRELLPGLSVLFMSGYTDEAIVHHGVLDSNVEFIQKPFTPAALVRKVREVLDAELVMSG